MYQSEYYEFAIENIADDFNSDIDKTIYHFGIVQYGINDISIASAFSQAYGHVLRFNARDEFWFCKGNLCGETAADACMLRFIVELRKKLESIPISNSVALKDLKGYERYDGRERALKSARPLLACSYKEFMCLKSGDVEWA